MTSATATTRNFNRFDGRSRDAGFAPGSDERIAKSQKREQRIHKQRLAKLLQNPVSGPSNQVIRGGELDPILPADFVAESIAKVQIHIARGHFDQAKAAIDGIAQLWELRKAECDPASVSAGEKLAWHVSQVFEYRTANLIEGACAGTIGSLLECFPLSFVQLPNAGPNTVRKIAERLMQIGVLSAEEAQQRIDQYADLIKPQ